MSALLDDVAKTFSRLRTAQSADILSAFYDARVAFQSLILSEAVRDRLHLYLNSVLRGVDVLPRDGSPGELVLFNTEEVIISIAHFHEFSQMLYTHPVRGFLCLLTPTPVIAKRFHLPNGWKNNIFDKSARLIAGQEQQIIEGEILTIDGSEELFRFDFDAPCLIAKCLIQIDCAQAWSFDPETLQAQDVESASAAYDAMMHAAEVLESIGSPSSASGFMKMSHHHVHFVRWDGIRKLVQIDRKAGLMRLHAVEKDDPHPEVRRAASAALQRLVA